MEPLFRGLIWRARQVATQHLPAFSLAIQSQRKCLIYNFAFTLKQIFKHFLYVLVFCLHVYLGIKHAVPAEPRRGHRTPGVGIPDGCELPSGLWELNPGPWHNSQYFNPEPLLQPLEYFYPDSIKLSLIEKLRYGRCQAGASSQSVSATAIICFWSRVAVAIPCAFL